MLKGSFLSGMEIKKNVKNKLSFIAVLMFVLKKNKVSRFPVTVTFSLTKIGWYKQ